MEDKNRTFDEKILCENNNLEKIIKMLDNIKDRKEIFVAFRKDKIQLYYKMTNILKININKNGVLSISVRDKSKDEKVLNLTKQYEDVVMKLGFNLPRSNSFNTLNLDEVIEKDWNEFFKIVTSYIDELKDGNSELAIQNQYATLYNGKDELYIVDTEFKQYFSNQKEQDENKHLISGKYDMIGLYKSNSKYRIVFIELKANKEACIGIKSGVINHINDMMKYLREYEKNNLNIKNNIKEMIEFNIRNKKTLKLLDSDILDVKKVDFETKPEFWVLYDFGNNKIEKADGKIPYIIDEITECSKKSKIKKIDNIEITDYNCFKKAIKEMNIKFHEGKVNEQKIKLIYENQNK